MKKKMKVAALLVASMICAVSTVAVVWLISVDVISNRFSGFELAEAIACWAIIGVLGTLSCICYAAGALVEIREM